MKRLLLSVFLSLIMIGYVFGEETTETVKETTEAVKETTEAEEEEAVEFEEHYIYEFPKIKPVYSFSGGYRFIDIKGSEKAAEFEYPHNSVMLSGELRALLFPHRIHIGLDFLNRKDYFWDISYAYRDVILSRWINRTSFHNLDNITLGGSGTNITDPSEKYGIKSGMDTVSLRFKTPDFPFHVYINGHFLDKEGERQYRFLENYTPRTSQKRKIDWETRNITAGLNTHFGPVEFDISHSEKRFDSGGDRLLHYDGIVPHSLIPDFKGSADTLKLHTSYTGKLVAATTLSKYSGENEYSRSKVDRYLGSIDITWIPMPRLAFFLKYRHKEADIDNPDTTPKQSISLKTDSFSGNVRYRAFKGITLNAEISHVNIDRQNSDEWNLPGTTVKDTASLSANVRILKNLNIKSKYIHEEVDEPAYNAEPDSKDRGVVSVSWTPLPFLLTYLSYDAYKGRHDGTHYFVNGQENVFDDRKISEGKVLGMVEIRIAENLSVGTSYAYSDSKTTQTLIYGTTGYVTDNNVPYKEKAHTVATNLNYKPRKNIDLAAGVSYTKSSANFFPSVYEAVTPISIASFSELKIRQTEYNLSGQYGLKDGWDIGLSYSYSKYDDVIENPSNPSRDGNAHIFLLSISKRWE